MEGQDPMEGTAPMDAVDALENGPDTKAEKSAEFGRRRAALVGLFAVGVALGFSELAHGIADRIPSLVISVGDVVVDKTPSEISHWAIETFGKNDKKVLLASTVIFTLVFGVGIGLLTRRHRLLGVGGIFMLGAISYAAGNSSENVSAVGLIIATSIAVFSGVATIYLLLASMILERSAENFSRLRESVPDLPASKSGGVERLSSRRAFLIGTIAAGTVAAGAAATGRYLVANAPDPVKKAVARLANGFPRAANPLAAPSAGMSFEVEGLSPLITPMESFYRIDTALMTPRVDIDTWKLRVKGMVEKPLTFTYEELLAMPLVEADVTLSCVSNIVGGDLIGNARWTGVLLREVLNQAGVLSGATQIVGRSVDGWTSGFPTEIAMDGRDALIAVGMNGEPLPIAHGFPARLVVPGLYGYVSATKWLKEIELTTWEAFDSYWVPRGWNKEGPIETQSRIDTFRGTTGNVVVAGVAWAIHAEISKVEVRIDEGAWRKAEIADALSIDTWVQWKYEWDAPEGEHLIQVRATNGEGKTQKEERRSPQPGAAQGWHGIRVRVSGDAEVGPA